MTRVASDKDLAEPHSGAAVSHADTLIFKGGGVKGLAFAGAVRELEQCFKFRTFVGTSAGAIAAALLAAGATGATLEEKLRGKAFREFLDGHRWAAFITIPLRGGIHPGYALSNWIRDELFESKGQLSDVKMLDLLPNRAVIYAAQYNHAPITFDTIGERRDSAVHAAVRASLSIPYFFQPQHLDCQWVYDGGLLANYPVSIFLSQERSRKIEPKFIALYLGPNRPRPLRREWQHRLLLGIWMERDDLEVVDKYRSRTVVIDTHPIGTIDFDLTEQEKDFLVFAGRAAALSFLESSTLLSPAQHSYSTLVQQRAELLRKEVIASRTRRRPATLRGTIARLLAATAVIFALAAAAVSIDEIMSLVNPLRSLEALAVYLRR
jgi:predicted acylesterase/phospholipase RssA